MAFEAPYASSRAQPIAFRDSEEVFGSPRNGNYMGVLEAIAQFDQFEEEHINRYGSKSKGRP